jgi:hypothetical protein
MNREINIPTYWEELTRLQFADVAEILFNAAGSESPEITRLKVLKALTGINFFIDSSKRAGCTQKIAEYTQFLYKITIDPDILQVITPELRKMLTWCLPHEIDEKKYLPELNRIASMLKPSISINLNIPVNLLPEIVYDGISYIGPLFTIDKHGVLYTDITACEYLDAQEYLSLYAKTNDINYLGNIASCFYRKNRKAYDITESQKNAGLFSCISPKFLKAVWLMVTAWQNYFYKHPVFGILFSESSNEVKNKISLGPSELIFTLSKEGFGNIPDIQNMRIDEFFALQVKLIKDSVAEMRGLKKNDAEIAKTLKIPIETIIKL